MTPDEATKACYDVLRAALPLSGLVLTQIGWDAVPFTPVPGTEHLKVEVRHARESRQQDTLGAAGNRRFETTAFLMIEVNAVAGLGAQRARQLGKLIADLYEGRTLTIAGDDITFLVANTPEGGDEGQWFRLTVFVPFRYQETR